MRQGSVMKLRDWQGMHASGWTQSASDECQSVGPQSTHHFARNKHKSPRTRSRYIHQTHMTEKSTA